MTMKLEQLPAVEPHWPYGTVAQFYIKRGVAVKDIGIRELAVLGVTEIEGGYRIRAGLMPNQYDPNDRQFLFEVDETGESAECVPWDDTLEAEYNPSLGGGGVKITPLEDRVIVVPEPPSVLEGVDVWEAFEGVDESQEGVARNDRR